MQMQPALMQKAITLVHLAMHHMPEDIILLPIKAIKLQLESTILRETQEASLLWVMVVLRNALTLSRSMMMGIS